ncbi:MAG: hypothetical protein MUC28_03620 [Planctomycetes bacterium]|jgi:hypothetical protein|nr:hypothetical protein [Planctomycetota bacterium]
MEQKNNSSAIKQTSELIFWAPRILSIIFIIFLALMSLDVFSPELNFAQTMLALFMHNIPALILLIVLIIAWKYEIVGGIAFILGGIIYITLLLRNPFEWYYLAWAAQISGMAFFIGALFLVGWRRKKKL